MTRLFILRWTPADSAEERRCRALWRRIESDRAWTRFLDRRGVLAHFSTAPYEAPPLILSGEQGAIFGPIFRTALPGSAPLTGLQASETSRLVEHGRGELMREYWGAYQAVLHDRGRDILAVVREPTGSRALFVGALGAATAIFSHAADYLALADAAEPELQFLSAFIGYARVVTPHTAIAGVTELMAGEELRVGRSPAQIERALVWTPVARRAPVQASDFDAAAGEIRDIVLETVRSWSQASPRIVHRLSGGLDSTIVLAALSKANAAEIVALNAYPENVPEGDERVYARVAAEACGVRLLEVAMSPKRIDYARLLDCHFGAKPSRSSMSFTDDTVTEAIASTIAHALVTSGQGGDQIFHRLRTPLIAADAWRDGCGVRRMLDIAVDTARLARRPVWDVLSAIARHGLLRQTFATMGPMRGGAMFISAENAAHALRMADDHPWSTAISRASPARALRMRHVMDLQYYHQPNGLNARFATQPVLASQPIIEFCLAVPPYVMTWGGRERALARAAFGCLVPEVILKRTGKGDTTRYHTAAIARQMPFIREMLIGGELERAGVLEPAVLRQTLAPDLITEASTSVAISSALLAEIWLRRFYGLRGRAMGSSGDSREGANAAPATPGARRA